MIGALCAFSHLAVQSQQIFSLKVAPAPRGCVSPKSFSNLMISQLLLDWDVFVEFSDLAWKSICRQNISIEISVQIFNNIQSLSTFCLSMLQILTVICHHDHTDDGDNLPKVLTFRKQRKSTTSLRQFLPCSNLCHNFCSTSLIDIDISILINMSILGEASEYHEL